MSRSGRWIVFRRAAALASGPAEVIDFLLPLWAASALGAAPAAIGVVVAVEALFSLVVRPGAGVLADRHDASLVAAAGAALSGTAFVLYAAAPSIEVVGLGAAFGGAGGALFWVAVRADVGRHLEQDPAAYARLLSSEQLGSLVAFMIALSLLGAVGYRPLFWLGAAAYGVAFALLLGLRGTVKPSRLDEAGRPVGIRAVGRALTPLIALTALTAGAEAGLSLLLILHLQSAFDLDPQEIALLFFPGAILLVVLPERAFEVAARLGVDPVRSLSRGGVPVEQSTVAVASRGSLGRGMGLYEAGVLLGILLSAPSLAAVYGEFGWRTACAAVAVCLVIGAALIPLVLRAVRVPDELAPAAGEP